MRSSGDFARQYSISSRSSVIEPTSNAERSNRAESTAFIALFYPLRRQARFPGRPNSRRTGLTDDESLKWLDRWTIDGFTPRLRLSSPVWGASCAGFGAGRVPRRPAPAEWNGFGVKKVASPSSQLLYPKPREHLSKLRSLSFLFPLKQFEDRWVPQFNRNDWRIVAMNRGAIGIMSADFPCPPDE